MVKRRLTKRPWVGLEAAPGTAPAGHTWTGPGRFFARPQAATTGELRQATGRLARDRASEGMRNEFDHCGYGFT